MKRKELISHLGLPLVVVALALQGCGGANPAQPVVTRGTLDLSQVLPAPTPTPYPAFGVRQRGSRLGASRDVQAAVAPYLKAQGSRVARPPVESLGAERSRRMRAASATSTSPAAPAAPALVAGAARADDARLIASKPESRALDADRYADRQSRKAEAYRGGDVIVIGAGTVLLVLLVVLIVVLLT